MEGAPDVGLGVGVHHGIGDDVRGPSEIGRAHRPGEPRAVGEGSQVYRVAVESGYDLGQSAVVRDDSGGYVGRCTPWHAELLDEHPLVEGPRTAAQLAEGPRRYLDRDAGSDIGEAGRVEDEIGLAGPAQGFVAVTQQFHAGGPSPPERIDNPNLPAVRLALQRLAH